MQSSEEVQYNTDIMKVCAQGPRQDFECRDYGWLGKKYFTNENFGNLTNQKFPPYSPQNVGARVAEALAPLLTRALCTLDVIFLKS